MIIAVFVIVLAGWLVVVVGDRFGRVEEYRLSASHDMPNVAPPLDEDTPPEEPA